MRHDWRFTYLTLNLPLPKCRSLVRRRYRNDDWTPTKQPTSLRLWLCSVMTVTNVWLCVVVWVCFCSRVQKIDWVRYDSSSRIHLDASHDKFDTRYRFIPRLGLELIGLGWLGWYSELTRPTQLKKNKQTLNQEIPSSFRSQQKSKTFIEIRDSFAK